MFFKFIYLRNILCWGAFYAKAKLPLFLLPVMPLGCSGCAGVCVCVCAHAQSHQTQAPWTVAHQAPPSIEFSRQECWSELPFPPPGDLPNSGLEPRSSELQTDSSLSEPQGKSMFCHMLPLSSLFVHAQLLSHIQLFVTPWTVARLLCPWNSPGKNTGVGSHSLLQRIFPTQELNPGLLHWRHILYHLSHQRSPSLLI